MPREMLLLYKAIFKVLLISINFQVAVEGLNKVLFPSSVLEGF